MAQDQWTDIDSYIADKLIPPDPALDAALKATEEAGLPAIAVSAPQGKMLHLLARAIGAKQILEIGMLGGYSTIWLARALPAGGKLITLEVSKRCAEVGRANIARAGLQDKVDIRLGSALEALPKLAEEKRTPFDLVFIDADKKSNPEYVSWAIKLCRPGSLIVVDNVVRDGAVLDAKSADPDIQGIRRMNAMLAGEFAVSATAIQTVGSKGYDGFALILVSGDS